MDDEALDDLVRRLTALVVKIDERDTTMAARLERYDRLIERYDGMLEELRTFNREQVAINQGLQALMRDVFRQRDNGHEA